MDTLPRLVSTKQYAARHGLKWRTVQKMCRDGRIEDAQKVGNWWIMPQDAAITVQDIPLPAYMLSRGEPYPEPEYRSRGAKPSPQATLAS